MDELKQKIIPVIQKYGVRKAAIFGSYARGSATKDSDVDILIEYPPRLGLFSLLAMKGQLEEVLKLKVDLVTYGSIHPYLRDRILSEQKVIYEG